MNSKFRVWDGEQMHLPPHDYIIKGNGVVQKRHWGQAGIDYIERDPEVTVIHYTGLDDAEGTPVYEGDILEYEGEPKGIVEYRAGSGGFCIGSTPLLEDLLVPSYGITVCGNKFQTTELLDDCVARESIQDSKQSRAQEV